MSYKLHEKIALQIIENFENSTSFEAKLPSQHELMQEHYVSRTIIIKALEILEEKDYIYTVKGKGSFFKDIKYPLYLQGVYSYDCALLEKNIKIENDVYSVEQIKANRDVATGLGVDVGTIVHKIIRVKTTKGNPIMVQVNYLLIQRFPVVKKAALQNKRLYVYLHENYNLQISHVKEKINAINPPALIYDLLDKSRNNSCLQVTRTSFEKDNIVEYTHTYIATELIEFNLTLDMEKGERLYNK